MIKELFLSVLGVSVPAVLITAVLFCLAPLIRRRYASKWMYRIWIFLAGWLLVPWGLFSPGEAGEAKSGGFAGEVQDFLRGPGSVPGGGEVREPGSVLGAGLSVELPAWVETAVVKAPGGEGGITWLDGAAYVWLGGAAVVWFFHLLSYVRCRGHIRRAGRVIEESGILRRIEAQRSALGIKCAVRAAVYSWVPSPMVIGFLHPVLVLPDTVYGRADAGADGRVDDRAKGRVDSRACESTNGSALGPEEWDFILKHELVHLKRRDTWVRLLMTAAFAVHWFNPFAWLMQRRASVDMELSCDELVVQGADYRAKRAYTEMLLSMLHKNCEGGTALTTQFNGGKKLMRKRFENILAKKEEKSGKYLLAAVAVLSLGLGTLAGCSVKEAVIAPDYGIEVRTDPDGDGRADRDRMEKELEQEIQKLVLMEKEAESGMDVVEQLEKQLREMILQRQDSGGEDGGNG